MGNGQVTDIVPTAEAFYGIFPKPAPKRDETVLSEFWEDVDNLPSRVPERDGYQSHSGTPHRSTVGPHPSHSGTLSYTESSKENPDGHNPPPTNSHNPE